MIERSDLDAVMEMTVKANRRTADVVRRHSDGLHEATRAHVTREADTTRAAVSEEAIATRQMVFEDGEQTRSALAAATGEMSFGQVLLALVLGVAAAFVAGIVFSGYAIVGDEPYWPVVIILAVAAGVLAFAATCLVAMQFGTARRRGE